MLELAIVLARDGAGGDAGSVSEHGSSADALLMHAGNEAQRGRWLPSICEGSRLATLALLESERALGSSRA